MKLVILFFVGIMILACKKKEDRSCWKVAGEPTSKIVELDHFYSLFLGPHLEYTLIQDTVEYMELLGAENLLNHVTATLEGDKLTINNTNKCNFLRSYKKKDIHVKLHFIAINNIEFQGTQPLRSEGVLNIPYFTFLIMDGAGPVDLTINSDAISGTVGHGYGDFTLHGNTKYANFSVNSNGYCDTRDLVIADSIDIISNTSVLSRFNVQNVQTRIEIKNTGNVEYFGLPSSLEIVRFGTGEVLDGN